MFNYALSLVRRRKLRTFLTSLGITISVVLLSFIIFGMQGLSGVITSEFESRFSPNQLIVTNQDFGFDFLNPGTAEDEEKRDPAVITPTVVADILDNSAVSAVDPQIIVSGFKFNLADSERRDFDPVIIIGANEISESSLILGFTGEKTELEPGEVYVGNVVADFYGLTAEEFIGEKIELTPSIASFFNQRSAGLVESSYEFEVVGVVDAGTDRIDVVFPLSTAAEVAADIGGFETGEEYLEAFGYDQVIVDAEEGRVEEAKEYIEDTYALVALSSEDLITFLGQITAVLTLALSLFAIIAAIVAAIGIINTMIMSIYEQTREIGIIKAIGASNKQVLLIFLIQAGFIGFLGAIIGLLVVFIAFLGLDPVIVELLQQEGLIAESFFRIDIVIGVQIVVGSIIIGMLAGLYPALKAARLDPVKALRYE